MRLPMPRARSIPRFGSCLALLLVLGGALQAGPSEAASGRWPDAASKSGVAMYLSYSEEYPTLQSHSAVDQLATSLGQAGVDTVFVQISSRAATRGQPTDLEKLSNNNLPFTLDVQYLLSALGEQNISACAAIFSTAVNGADPQARDAGCQPGGQHRDVQCKPGARCACFQMHRHRRRIRATFRQPSIGRVVREVEAISRGPPGAPAIDELWSGPGRISSGSGFADRQDGARGPGCLHASPGHPAEQHSADSSLPGRVPVLHH